MQSDKGVRKKRTKRSHASRQKVLEGLNRQSGEEGQTSNAGDVGPVIGPKAAKAAQIISANAKEIDDLEAVREVSEQQALVNGVHPGGAAMLGVLDWRDCISRRDYSAFATMFRGMLQAGADVLKVSLNFGMEMITTVIVGTKTGMPIQVSERALGLLANCTTRNLGSAFDLDEEPDLSFGVPFGGIVSGAVEVGALFRHVLGFRDEVDRSIAEVMTRHIQADALAVMVPTSRLFAASGFSVLRMAEGDTADSSKTLNPCYALPGRWGYGLIGFLFTGCRSIFRSLPAGADTSLIQRVIPAVVGHLIALLTLRAKQQHAADPAKWGWEVTPRQLARAIATSLRIFDSEVKRHWDGMREAWCIALPTGLDRQVIQSDWVDVYTHVDTTCAPRLLHNGDLAKESFATRHITFSKLMMMPQCRMLEVLQRKAAAAGSVLGNIPDDALTNNSFRAIFKTLDAAEIALLAAPKSDEDAV